MRDPSRVRVSGPLAQFAPGFCCELVRVGYTPVSAAAQLRLLAHLSRWLEGEGLGCDALSPRVLARFVEARVGSGYSSHRSGRSLELLLGYLREVGATPAGSPPADGPVERLLARYCEYLRVERGLTAGTVKGYVAAVSPFLRGRLTVSGLELERLSSAEVTAFVVRRCPGQARGPARLTVTALRSLLVFLHVEGLVAAPLAEAVPAAASWRLSGLPRPLEWGEVRSLLGSCDRGRGIGQRDYAILVLLARLALRAGEVAALSLDDLDWRRGELVVAGKGGRLDRMPLPIDVGEALAGYLRDGRPAAECRECVPAGARAAPRPQCDSGEPGRS